MVNGAERLGENGNASDPDCILGREGGLYKAQREKAERYAGSRDAPGYGGTGWNNFPTQPPVCFGNDGLSSKLDGITFSKWRTESIKAAGNAIVPQVALQIFKSIQEYERLHN
jgi:DNA (cytosine-5)-methyltransferase 1